MIHFYTVDALLPSTRMAGTYCILSIETVVNAVAWNNFQAKIKKSPCMKIHHTEKYLNYVKSYDAV